MAKKLKNFTLDEDICEKVKAVAKIVNKTESFLVNHILEKELDVYSKDKYLIETDIVNKRRRK